MPVNFANSFEQFENNLKKSHFHSGHLITINANVTSADEVSFPKLLKAIEKFGKNIYWSIMWFEAMGRPGSVYDVRELKKKIHDAPNGIPIIWSELVEFPQNFDQIIEMNLSGNKNPVLVNRYKTNFEWLTTSYLTIQMFDGYLWLISCQDQSILDHLSKIFPDSKIEPLVEDK